MTRTNAIGALALVTVYLATTAAQAQAPQQAGVAAAVRGDVLLAAATARLDRDVVGKNVTSGDQIFLGDMIESGPDSGLQIMLLDETVFTIGPSAAMTIDTFVYDPASGAGEVTTQVLKGAFRFVSGKVAKNEPSKMNVKTPVGTIGIRGTSAAGVITPVDPNTPGGPVTGTFVLLGPGAGNNAGEAAGRILVTNGDTTVEISRSGFGTIVAGPTLPPGTPVRIDPAIVAALTGGLGTDGSARPQQNNNGRGGGGQGGGGQGGGPGQGQGGGQQQAQGGTGTQQVGGGGTVGGSSQTILQGSGQSIGGSIGTALNQFTAQNFQQDQQQASVEATENSQTFADGITTLADLKSLSSGVFVYPSQTFAMDGPGLSATYTINYTVDFGNQSTSGNVQISTGTGFAGGVANFPLITNLFNLNGTEAFNTESGVITAGNVVSGTIPGANSGGSNSITVDYDLSNSDGALAKVFSHGVIYSENGGTPALGAGHTSR
ncbi:MAG: FecR domain-containing protein [Alphaproteobacteria bacterium]|nr:FecR domain-containing protein [Alphaproteobacteria bacterium]